jgi:hypothetical protein
MEFRLNLGHAMALAILLAVSPAFARDLTPYEAVDRIKEGYDPFRAPKVDRLPDDYVNGKPYWLPRETSNPLPREALSGSAATAMAADRPLDNHDPYRRPVPDRVPDDYVDGRPYWLSGPQLVKTPTGFVGYSMWEAEIGGRYFWSTGRTRKELFGDPPGSVTQLNSRLTYTGLSMHAGEVFGRVEHATGFFLKGFVGGGGILSGKLQDEDFPPAEPIYSSTNSEQRDGRLVYGSIDGGWAWRVRDHKVGFFVGYFHYFERVNAFGCVQTAFNPFVCAPPIPSSVLGIREDTNWDALRFGINGEVKFGDGWKFSGEFAWLPYVSLDAKDTHFLRLISAGCQFDCFAGPIPERGVEALSSLQVEGILSYTFASGFSVGVGARYWNVHTNPGHVTVDFPVAIPVQQAMTFKTERYGAFLQGSYKFGDLQPSMGSSAQFAPPQ